MVRYAWSMGLLMHYQLVVRSLRFPIVYWAYVLLVLGLIPSASSAQVGGEKAPKIVILHDSNNLGLWRQSFDNAYHNFLNSEANATLSVRVASHYFGIDRVPEGQTPTQYIELLKYENSMDPASMVVAVFSQSSRFVERWGAEIWGNIPHIYIDNDPLPATSIDQTSINRVSFNADLAIPISSTLSLIPALLPGTQRLVVVAGSGSYGKKYSSTAKAVVEGFQLPYEVEFYEGLPPEILLQTLASYNSNDTAVLFLAYSRDTEGMDYPTQEVLRLIADDSALPIFGLFDSMLGQGMIGGAILPVEGVAYAVGQSSIELLNNEQGSVAGIKQLPFRYVFDDQQLMRWNIDRNRLPEDSLVENEEPNFLGMYRREVATAAVVIAFQLLLILALVYSLRRRRIAESRLMEQAKEIGDQIILFESVINSIPDAVLISDANRKIYATNKSVKILFGYASKELIGEKPYSLQDIDNNAMEAEFSTRNGETEIVKPEILNYRRKNGEVFSGETIETKIVSATGQELGYFSLIRDVSRRLLKEQESKQSQKMEALGNLVGGIAHDINNVLGVITAYAEVLQAQNEKPEHPEGLAKILKAAQRGSEICHQITSFSRDSGVEQSHINLLDVVKETLKLMSVSIPTRINISLNCSGDRFLVNANFTQMQQVIMNLATNASHAIGKGAGSLTINLREASYRQEKFLFQGTLPAGDYIALSVQDTGSGIEQSVIEKIFEPFFTTKKQQEGTGMGLAMVYRITKSHNASIDLQSRVGEGTTITVYLPRVSLPSVADPEDADNGVIKGKQQTILLVDDEVDLLDSVYQLLMSIGYEVFAFSDTDDALNFFESHSQQVDILVSDQSMPKHSGLELARQLKAVKKELPVVLCTGYSEILDGESIEELSIQAIVRKPFTLSTMSKTIGDALRPQAH